MGLLELILPPLPSSSSSEPLQASHHRQRRLLMARLKPRPVQPAATTTRGPMSGPSPPPPARLLLQLDGPVARVPPLSWPSSSALLQARTRPMQPAATTTNSSSLPSLTREPRSRLLRLDAPAVRASPLRSSSSIAPLRTSCRRQSLLSAARPRPTPVQPAATTTTSCSLSSLTKGTMSGHSLLSRSRCSSATRTTCLGAETYRSIAYYSKGLEILMATLGEHDPPSQRPAGDHQSPFATSRSRSWR